MSDTTAAATGEGSCFSMEASLFCLAEPPHEMTPEDWQIIMGRIVGIATFFVTDGFRLVQGFAGEDKNYGNALNALRCAIISLFDGGWYFIGAAYHFMRYFEIEQELVTIIHEYQPVLCTCSQEVSKWGELLSIPSIDFDDPEVYKKKQQSLLELGVCSEEAASKDLKNKLKTSLKNTGKKTTTTTTSTTTAQ